MAKESGGRPPQSSSSSPSAERSQTSAGKQTRVEVESAATRSSPTAQRKGDGAATRVQKAVESAPTSGGADLPSSVASDVAGAFGFFPDVKVHTGGESQKAADSIGARAFTSGSDIHLAAGESPGDTRLMAHEVAHTVQQDGASGAQPKLEVSRPGDPLEVEADRVADAVLGGAPAKLSRGAAGAIIQREGGDSESEGDGDGDGDGGEGSSDIGSRLEELLSYSAIDWAITDAEATEAFNLLTGLEGEALSRQLSAMGETLRVRLLDNLPANLRRNPGFPRILTAMGPEAIQPYIEEILSYGLFDWAITDADAQTAFQVFRTLTADDRVALWTGLTAELRQRFADNLMRESVPAQLQDDLKSIFTATPDAEVDTLQLLMQIRFNLTFQASTDEDETPMAWEAGGLRRLWNILEILPREHVEQNSALSLFERYAHDEGDNAGGFYGGRNEVAMGYDPANLGNDNTAAEANANRGEGNERSDDPLLGVNRFDKVALHEVGHAVDEAGGHHQSYCVGNSGGGNWESHDTGSMAETLVTASAGVINGWPNAEAKTKIIAALQEAIDERKPGELDGKIDAISDLTAEQTTRIKADDACTVIKNHMALDGGKPWYKYPSDGAAVALGGRVYQESYSNDWWSYEQEARERKVSTYQFRAPYEWFAEAYATYYYPVAGEGKGALLRRVDGATAAWISNNVDPDHGMPNDTGGVGDFPTDTGGDTAMA